MANIKVKRSAVPGKIPQVGDLQLGEFALNTYDGKLFAKKNVGGVESIVEFGQTTAGVTTFNTRSGAVTLTSSDVTSALGYTPYNSTNPSGYITSSALTPYITSATAASTYQPLDADLTSIAGLAGTSGLLKKTAANTWSLDTNTYLTGNQSISISGDATGSGTTAIALTLANSGVTAGTYTKVTVDAKGRVTTGTSLASADLPTYTGTITSSQVTTALGYTPLSTSGGTISGTLNVTRIDGGTGQQLVLNAGESGSGATGQTNEFVYINAESGLEINSSPDNWTSGWAGRNTATICGPTGTSTFPGTIIAPSVSTTLAGTTTVIANQAVVRATVATTTQTAVDTWAAATYRSAKYVVQITQGTNYQVSEILVIHNGTTATFTEYAVLTTGTALGSLTCDVSGGNVRLLVTMGSATSATLNISKTTTVV